MNPRKDSGILLNVIIHRWQAQVLPSLSQAKLMFRLEGLNPEEEVIQPGKPIAQHRHPFDEVRMIIEGALLIDINGNKMLLRTGDKIMIPSYTKHSKQTHGDIPCVSIFAKKVFYS